MKWWVQCENNPTEITRQQLIKEVKETQTSVLQHLQNFLKLLFGGLSGNDPDVQCQTTLNSEFTPHTKEKRKNPQGCLIIQFDLNPCFSFRNLPDLPHTWNPEVVFPPELKVCRNNHYIPVSSACKTMATQSKRKQQLIKPKPQGLCANSDVSRVEELVEAACSGFLPQELCVIMQHLEKRQYWITNPKLAGET